jgi:hypothetical protein
MKRLKFIFNAVNVIASKELDAVTQSILVETVLQEIDAAKRERRAKAASAGSCR